MYGAFGYGYILYIIPEECKKAMYKVSMDGAQKKFEVGSFASAMFTVFLLVKRSKMFVIFTSTTT